VALAALGSGVVGLVDDLFEGRRAKGFRGHLGALRQGRLTTGMIKIAGVGLTALASSAWVAVRRPGVPGRSDVLLDTVVDTVLVAGAYVPAPPVMTGGERNRVLALADAAPDPVLSDDVSYLAMRGRPAVIDDGFLSEHVRNEGLWNTDGIVAGIKEHRYTLVLTPRSGDDEAILRTVVAEESPMTGASA
jgi:hypothetical protein